MEQKLLAYLKEHEAEIFADLKELVLAEASTSDIDQLAHVREVLIRLIGFTQSIAKELGKDHINANAIAVPTTQTPMLKETDFDVFVEDELRDIPWGRIGTPEDIADMVLYLSSDASEYVTGQVLAPNGGRRTPV